MSYSPFRYQAPIPKPGEPFHDVFRKAIPVMLDDGTSFAETQARGVRIAVRIEDMPARFYSADVTLPTGQVKRFGTGSGTEAGQLLEDLCNAFFAEQATFGQLYDEDGAPVRSLCRKGKGGGRDVHTEKLADGWLVLFLEETESELGPKPAQAFSVKDASLAKRLVSAICSDMLTVEPVRKNAKVQFV